jgi:centromere protein I
MYVLIDLQHPNQEWGERLREIQEDYFQKTQDALPPEKRTFRVTRRSVNRKHAALIPEVRTSLAQEVNRTVHFGICLWLMV